MILFCRFKNDICTHQNEAVNMPKCKGSHRTGPPSAAVSAQQLTTDHVSVNHEINVKIEPDNDDNDDGFDPMQSESIEMALLNAIHLTAGAVIDHEPEIDAKLECDVDIVNSFRPEMIENSHEFKYMVRSNISHEEIVPAKIVTKTTKPKRERKVSKCMKRSKLEPVKIEMNGRKMLKCPLCNETTTTRLRAKIQSHIRQAHTRDKPFKCIYCHSRYSSLSGTESYSFIAFVSTNISFI